MSNELVLIETKIKEGDAALTAAEKYGAKAVEMKIAAGKLYAEARNMCHAIGLTWKDKCQEITSRSYSQVAKVMQIAKADDPYAEEARQREVNADSHRNNREMQKVSDVRDPDDATDVSTDVMPKEADPIAYILTRIQGLTRDDMKRFLGKLADQLKPLDIFVSYTIM